MWKFLPSAVRDAWACACCHPGTAAKQFRLPAAAAASADVLQDIDLEQEVEQASEAPDCSMGMDTGHELIEPHNGLLPVSSQALIDTAC